MFSSDLLIAVLIVGALAALAFIAGRQVRANRKVLFASTIFTAVMFSLLFQGNLGWAKLVPFSSAVLLSNFTPVLVAFVAGFSCRGLELREQKRPVLVAVLSVLALVCLVAPVVRPIVAPPRISGVGKSQNLIVLQSHESTCAPASAATLLRLSGIDSDEKQMVGLCLTSEFGTEALGLYRGLKLGSEKYGKTVGVASRNPYQWRFLGHLPNVALVSFPKDEFSRGVTDSELQSMLDGDWISPRVFGRTERDGGHAVVVLGYANGRWQIADPAIGLVKWTDEEFQNRFTGDAIFIEKR